MSLEHVLVVLLCKAREVVCSEKLENSVLEIASVALREVSHYLLEDLAHKRSLQIERQEHADREILAR